MARTTPPGLPHGAKVVGLDSAILRSAAFQTRQGVGGDTLDRIAQVCGCGCACSAVRLGDVRIFSWSVGCAVHALARTELHA